MHRILLSALVITASLAAQTGVAPQTPKRLVADYGYWSRTQTPPYSSAQIPFSKITHINHAGVNFASDGTLMVPDGFLEPDLIAKGHANGVKVMLLLGGDFPSLETNPSAREVLMRGVYAFITENGYDGIDIDWEYPASNADRAFFLGLLTGLREMLPSPEYIISADVPPWGGSGYAFDGTTPLVDYFNIMMYDCAGPWTDDGQLNSAIFPDPSNPEAYMCEPGGSVKEAADIYLTQLHIPAIKLNMGTPFYGYFYTNVTALWGPCNPCDDSTVIGENYGTWIKQRINRGGWKTYYDTVSLVPYMLRADGSPGFVTYDDPFSTYTRIRYSVWGRELGGSFLWALDEDYDGQSQDLLDAMYQATKGGK